MHVCGVVFGTLVVDSGTEVVDSVVDDVLVSPIVVSVLSVEVLVEDGSTVEAVESLESVDELLMSVSSVA